MRDLLLGGLALLALGQLVLLTTGVAGADRVGRWFAVCDDLSAIEEALFLSGTTDAMPNSEGESDRTTEDYHSVTDGERRRIGPYIINKATINPRNVPCVT